MTTSHSPDTLLSCRPAAPCTAIDPDVLTPRCIATIPLSFCPEIPGPHPAILLSAMAVMQAGDISYQCCVSCPQLLGHSPFLLPPFSGG